MHQDNESSVEEILESIKKVMARDSRVIALEQRRRRESQGVVEPVDDDEADEVLDLGEAELMEEHQAEIAPADMDEAATDDAPLTTEAACDAMRQNFAALAMLAEPGAQPRIVRSGSRDAAPDAQLMARRQSARHGREDGAFRNQQDRGQTRIAQPRDTTRVPMRC